MHEVVSEEEALHAGDLEPCGRQRLPAMLDLIREQARAACMGDGDPETALSAVAAAQQVAPLVVLLIAVTVAVLMTLRNTKNMSFIHVVNTCREYMSWRASHPTALQPRRHCSI